MTKHMSCKSTASMPPLSLWSSNATVSFPNQKQHTAAYQRCCGVTSHIKTYRSNCFEFCDTYGNQTEVHKCIQDAGAIRATKWTHNNGGGLSKPSLGVVVMVVGSLVLGTM